MANLTTLFDNFNGAVLDTSKWIAEDGQVVQSGGEIRVTTTLAGIDTGLNSSSPYSLVGGYARCKLVDAGNQSLASVHLRMLRIADEATEGRLAFYIAGGNISAMIVSSAALETTWASQAYVTSSYTYLQIKERAGTIYWDYSPDGFSWANLFSTTVDFGVTNVLARFSFESGAEASTTVLKFDDFNIASGVASLTKPTLRFTVNTTTASKTVNKTAALTKALITVKTNTVTASKVSTKTATLTQAVIRFQVNTTTASIGVQIDNKTATLTQATVKITTGVTTASKGVSKTANLTSAIASIVATAPTCSKTVIKTATTTTTYISIKTNNLTCTAVSVKTATMTQAVIRIVVGQVSGQIPASSSGITITILLRSQIEKNLLTKSRMDKFINDEDFLKKRQGISKRLVLKSQVNNV